MKSFLNFFDCGLISGIVLLLLGSAFFAAAGCVSSWGENNKGWFTFWGLCLITSLSFAGYVIYDTFTHPLMGDRFFK
jgi:hypothetical protein